MNARHFYVTILAVLSLSTPLVGQDVPTETYTLPNGLFVMLHEDHSLPQVALNLWYQVGAKDEALGRSGFAHLFEHLMFMGTERVPDNRFDVIMEGGGGANNASTGEDRTNYYSWGSSSLLPTLIWLDADRMEALGDNMTQEKVNLQCDVVRNELRQVIENSPYGVAELEIPHALYPAGHPYYEPVIGSHEDLQAATLEDVKDFFATYYVPGNASLVVAGDFDSAEIRPLIDTTFGAVPARAVPSPVTAEPVALAREVRRIAVDEVEFPRIYLIWHSPAAYGPGDAEMELLALLLADGPSSRLHRRLVIDEGLARDVSAYQYSKQLGSEFRIEVTGKADVDLEKIKRVVLHELDSLATDGVSEAELQRVKASWEVDFLQRSESLRRRADLLNQFRFYLGDPDSFDAVRQAHAGISSANLQLLVQEVFGPGRLDLRILPKGTTAVVSSLDRRPEALPEPDFEPLVPETFTLENGISVHLLSRPGTGLFGGALLVDGGEALLAPHEAGASSLLAALLTSGSGARDVVEFADAVALLGARIDASSSWHGLTVEVRGLSTHRDATLDLFADAILRPALEAEDFEREKSLALAAIRSRVERPTTVGVLTGRTLLFGRDDPRGRPVSGHEETVAALDLQRLEAIKEVLLDPSRAQLVFAGDLQSQDLRQALNERFGEWKDSGSAPEPMPSDAVRPPEKSIVLVDRPGAPQTFIYLVRTVEPTADATQRVVQESLDTLFGGSFTSRLNQNIREEHGFSYGASAGVSQDGDRHLLQVYTSVQTEVTGAALAELEKEFGRLATGDVTPDELTKAVKTVRHDLVTQGETTAGLTAALLYLVSDGLPLDTARRSYEALATVDLDAVNKRAGSGLYDWTKLLVVLVGDADAVVPQLEEAGFGAPLKANSEGRILED